MSNKVMRVLCLLRLREYKHVLYVYGYRVEFALAKTVIHILVYAQLHLTERHINFTQQRHKIFNLSEDNTFANEHK